MIFFAPIFFTLVAHPAWAQTTDDGWIDVDDDASTSDEGNDDGWIDVEPDPNAPEAPSVTEPSLTGPAVTGPTADVAPPATVAAPPKGPDPAENEDELRCPKLDLKADRKGTERILLLPLKDSAANPEGTRSLTDATEKALRIIRDLDYTDPGQVERGDNDELIPPEPAEPIFTDRLRFQVVDGRCLAGNVAAGQLGADVIDALTCSRSSCMSDLAEATGADFIVYGQLATAEPPLLLYEVKLYAHGVGRIVSRATAEAPNARFLVPAVSSVLVQLIAPPPPPPPRAAPPLEPSLLESPFLIAGVTVVLGGIVLGSASLAWLIDAELKLGTPGVHRDLKDQSLRYWPYVAAAGAVAPFLIAAGAGLIGVSPFLLPDIRNAAPQPEGEAQE